MIKFEITDEMLQNAEERLVRMSETAEPIFNELFPNLDFVNDFWQNENINDIEFLLSVVENAMQEKGYEKYGTLHKLLDWTFEELAYEELRKDAFEIVRSLDKGKKEEFFRWMKRQGFPNEAVQNPAFQAEVIWSFFSETMFREH